MSFFNSNRPKEFLGLTGPSGYIPGVGRGATGFTTRSDIGPARDNTDVPDERHHQFKQNKEDDANENLNDSNYDEFSGYSGNLCSQDPYDEDDLEADTIYENIDKHMDERRKEYREKRLAVETEEYRRKRPKIQQLFSDLKREMSTVTKEEWMNIPEVGDKRNRMQRNPRPDSYHPKPDSLIAMQYADNTTSSYDPRENMNGGFTSVNPMENIDLQNIGKARTKLMDSQLGRVSDNISGQTVIDPKGYLTDLQSMLPQFGMTSNNCEVSDIGKARRLLQCVIEANPKKVEGWIALVRFEESYKKIHEAKQNLLKGCMECPESEAMWLEAIRIMKLYEDNIAKAKSFAAKAIKNVPDSVSLWVAAANLENTTKAKRAVYRKALENIPDSVKLWKLAIELEDEYEARLLLEGAVKCCPTSVELWLALAKLNPTQEAKKILNLALAQIPGDKKIWIAGCKLEEADGNEERIDMLVKNALKYLKAKQVEINRNEWIKDAEEAEMSGYKITAQKIIQRVIEIGVEDQDRKHTWLADAESCEDHGCYECARAIYSVCVSKMPHKKGIWKKAASFEKQHGARESYESILEKSVQNCPNVEVLWLMWAKSKWEAGDIDGSRSVLNDAFKANPNSEEIMLAAVKLESENNEFERARKLLQKARQSVETSRVWMKSARLEWCLGDLNAVENLLVTAVQKFSTAAKLWMMLGQARKQKGDNDGALEAFKEGCSRNGDSIPLWTLKAGLEEECESIARARNTLEKARSLNPTSPELWVACIRLELRDKKVELAQNLMSRALQSCPSSGILWAENVQMAPKKQKLSRAKDALEKCEHSEHVLLAAAKVFWEHGFETKAREWLMKTLKAEKLYGDAWAYLYKLECIYGTEDSRKEIVDRCMMAEPRFGEYWCAISKDVSNWKLKTKDILMIVAQKVPLPI